MTPDYDYLSIAKMIDHSLLNPALTTPDLEDGCALAVRYNVASVCILPYALARCAAVLSGTTVRASTTIGFPHGGHTTAIKLAEIRQALADGGQELDAVINISKARSGDWPYVRAELAALADAVHAGGAQIKVIFENAYLEDEAKIRLCGICAEVGADWVKTSTGYAPTGATLAAACPGQGGGRYSRPGRAAGGAGHRRKPRGCNKNADHVGRLPQPPGPGTD